MSPVVSELSESEIVPPGYFPGEPRVTLQNGKWRIIRKLGWGPHSSTWLAVSSEDPNNIEAIKIYTVAATQDPLAATECDLLEGPLKDNFHTLPSLRSSFYEESVKGKHLVLVLHVLGSSVESFRVKNGGSFPLATVKKIVADVLESLVVLQKKGVVHGAVTAENILFSGLQQGSDIIAAMALKPSVEAEGVADAEGRVVKVVKSQPFEPESVEDIIQNEVVYLSSFGHAQTEQDEASMKLDILALGSLIYLLLTGSQLSTPPENIQEALTSSGKLAKEDIPPTATFLELLLADPAKRPSADEVLGNSWVIIECPL